MELRDPLAENPKAAPQPRPPARPARDVDFVDDVDFVSSHRPLRMLAPRPDLRGTSISSASSMTSTSPLALVFLSNPDVIC